MICLGSVMFFRREKYRLVSQYESFSAFHFCTIIAVSVRFCRVSETARYGIELKRQLPLILKRSGPPLPASETLPIGILQGPERLW